jgi:hypothetical protein
MYAQHKFDFIPNLPRRRHISFSMTTFLPIIDYPTPAFEDDDDANDMYDHFYRHLTDSSSHLSALDTTNVVLAIVLVILILYYTWHCFCYCHEMMATRSRSRQAREEQPVTEPVQWSDVPLGAQAA